MTIDTTKLRELALLDELTRTQGSLAIASAALSAAEREVQRLRAIEAAARSLDGRKVAAALGTTGRPAEMAGGKRSNIYLDAASREIAERIGNGNISEGIRLALASYK